MLSAASRQIGRQSQPQRVSLMRPLTFIQKAGLSYYHNFHHPPIMFVNGIKKEQDYNVDLYSPHIRAFLTKRWTSKREIPPKVAVMSDMGPGYRQIYQQQRLAFGEYMYDLKRLERLYDAEAINTQFLHSIYFEDYEKNMYTEVMQKKVMNGSVVPMLDKPKHDAIDKKIAGLTRRFYKGDKLTDLEIDIERQYMSQKFQKQGAYRDRKTMGNKTVWTVSDLNRYQDQSNYRMNDPEYFGSARPHFEPFDLDKALSYIPVYQDI